MGFLDDFAAQDELDFWIDSMEQEEEYLRSKESDEFDFEDDSDTDED